MLSLSLVIIDDDASQRDILSGYVRKLGCQVTSCVSGEAGLEAIRKNYVDVVITDFRMPGMNGLDVLKKVKVLNPEIRVIILTAYGTIEDSVSAMKQGAWDYISKPVELEELKIKLKKLEQLNTLVKENQVLRSQVSRQNIVSDIVYKSPAMAVVINFIARVSQSDAAVLIQGESGTGKEMVAKAIHQASRRVEGPFIAVNCAAIPESLFESEFFGHEKGAFTGAHERQKGQFEMANKGTLFLDEVADIPLNFQVKLLRTLQNNEFKRLGSSQTIRSDVRIISAANKNIQQRVNENQFRSDLFYRLNVIPITIPPLRDRKEDIPLLVNHFIEKYTRKNTIPITGISAEGMDQLLRYDYPGNVRELENIIERAIILARSDVITKEDLPLEYNLVSQVTLDRKLPQQVSQLEKQLIRKALRQTNQIQTKAAEKLGVSERVLRYKMKKYALK